MGDLSKADNHYTYPAGLVNFTLTCTSPGATTRVSQFFYGIDAAHLVARKYDSRTRTYETIPNAEITTVTIAGRQAVKISYDITDGGPLDEDGTVNGVIVDPSGPAMLQNSVGSPDTGFRSQPLWIPILGWIVGLGVTVSSVLSFSVIKCRDR
jgi:hypothetical protein